MARLSGDTNPSWKGGQTTSPKGYVYYMRPDHPRAMKSGYVKRANLVMEALIGRYLEPGEQVHHKNHVPGDDSPENLELHTASSHARLHGAENRVVRPIKAPRKQVEWPSAEDLAAWVSRCSLREVAKELGCSHVAVWAHLRRAN